jgi:hypothetical protein
MADQDKRNLHYFEEMTMRKLYDCMAKWQLETHKQLLSAKILKDGHLFCCIAFSN